MRIGLKTAACALCVLLGTAPAARADWIAAAYLGGSFTAPAELTPALRP